MGTHVGAIGFSSAGADFSDEVRRLLQAAEPRGSADEGRTRLVAYVDASGSSATVTLESGALTCFTPGFTPGLVIRATCGALMPNDCRFERPLMVDAHLGDLDIPLALTIDDLALTESAFIDGQEIELEVAGLAESLTVFADEGAFRASGTPMAVASLIPSGLFAVGVTDPAAHRVSSRILMSGVVVEASLRRHDLFDHPFAVLVVRSLGGEWPVAVDIEDLDGPEPVVPAPGSIISGTFWLSGHLRTTVGPEGS